MEDQFSKLTGICYTRDIGFTIQFENVENNWWGWISSAAPEEEMTFRRHSSLTDLLSAMISHVEGKK